jgi:DNA topoisomerase-1
MRQHSFYEIKFFFFLLGIMNHNNNICLLSSYFIYCQFGGKKKWQTLRHNGLLFPQPYVKHNIPVLYNNNPVELNIDAEEYASLYAKYIETPYINNATFKRNFWKDWREKLGEDHIIKSLDGCDFSKIYNYLLQKREEKKQLTTEQKEQEKKEEEKYKIAIVDGKEQPVGNFRIEPPGIFIGRGCNPKLGKVKRRIYPEDIIINIGKDEPIPELPDFMIGHSWGKIVHDHDVEWLASWKDDITNKIKYVWLGAQSDLKAQSDMNKFNFARKLKRKIKTIREQNEQNLKSDQLFMRQIATALYFIDKFALRVGNEKGEDESDTVGVTSLRVEHIKLLEDDKVELDFMGKDYIRFKRTVSVEPQVYKNLKEFMGNKNLEDELFDKINSNDVNKYLQSFMSNLTAKVFRTYNASNLFQKELSKITKKFIDYNEADKINLLLDEFNKANAKVALLCNHQKNVSQMTNKQIDNINENIKKNRTRLRKMRASKRKNPEKILQVQDKIKKLKAKKSLKIELKNISLGTSKINYIDPRITVAFMKTFDFPVDKVFSKTLQEKFKWAFDVDEDFRF